jgi:hypothetical protein
MGFHAGHTVRLPAPLRTQPFDAGVGTSAAGAPVVTFSHCARAPGLGGATGTLLAPGTGQGCRVRVLPLGGRRELSPPIPAPGGVSDTTPSISRGVITFARHDPRHHGHVWQVLSWSPRTPRRLLTLPHGRIPSCPETHGCRRQPSGEVGALDSDGAVVTFEWTVEGEGIFGEGAWEERVDSANGAHSALADGDVGHEACTAPNHGPHELEYVWPEAPIASGSTAVVPELYGFSCFQGFASVIGMHGPVPGHGSKGKLEAIALALAQTNGTTYALVPTQTQTSEVPTCSAPTPCDIEQVTAPVPTPQRNGPPLPFQ